MSSESVYPNPEPPVPEFPGTILGIVVTLILMCATMSVVIYYRRRFNHLKTELAHVHYHAGPDNHQGNRRKFHKNFIENFNADHDHHHFDNPVYSNRDNKVIDTHRKASQPNINETEFCEEVMNTVKTLGLSSGVKHCESDSGVSSAQSTGTVPWGQEGDDSIVL